jgi:uncharacterized protein YcgL (UPF0745 family)
MNCTIYRSDTKPGLYLYLHEDKTLEDIPQELLKLIGKYTKSMDLDLTQRNKLGQEDIEKVKQNLLTQGYHLQFPQDLVKNVLNYT